jgi:hypothetical protein
MPQNSGIQHFLRRVSNSRTSLDDVLKPAIEIEHELRDLFATGKSHERLADPHVGLVDVFNVSDETRATRANRSRRPGSFCCCHPCAAVPIASVLEI